MTRSLPLSRRGRVAVALGAASAVIALAAPVVAAAVGDDRDAVFVGEAKISPTTGAVSAQSLWQLNLDALACLERAGVDTIGPFPSADGSGVNFSFAATPKALEAEQACSADLAPAAMRFALDRAPSELAAMQSLRASIEACVEGRGVAVPDVAADAKDPDAGFAHAAFAAPDAFRACAASASAAG